MSYEIELKQWKIKKNRIIKSHYLHLISICDML